MSSLTKPERSWILYDWANSVHSTIISTAIFPLWFGQVAANGGLSRTQTTFWLSSANAGYAAIVFILAPVLGTLSDYRGMRKKLFTHFWLLGCAATAALVLVGSGGWMTALVLYMLTFVGFAGANVFYDASLPDVTTPEKMDRISAMGFGYGYIGGSTIPFFIALAVIALLSGMDLSGGLPSLGVKISFGITALWWLIFTIPFIRNVKQVNGIEPVPSPMAESFRRLGRTFLTARKNKIVFLFLVAYFFYIDGVNTIIKMATNFASSIGLGSMVLLATIIGIQILAFPFALLYGRLATRFGPRKMLYTGIIVYSLVTLLGTVMPLVSEAAALPIFISVAFLVASSQGGIQAISRSYFASIIPDNDLSGEYFGLYNTMGKFAAIIGPVLMGVFPRLAFLFGIADERVAYSFGVGALFILFILGWIFLSASGRLKEIPSQN